MHRANCLHEPGFRSIGQMRRQTRFDLLHWGSAMFVDCRRGLLRRRYHDSYPWCLRWDYRRG